MNASCWEKKYRPFQAAPEPSPLHPAISLKSSHVTQVPIPAIVVPRNRSDLSQSRLVLLSHNWTPFPPEQWYLKYNRRRPGEPREPCSAGSAERRVIWGVNVPIRGTLLFPLFETKGLIKSLSSWTAGKRHQSCLEGMPQQFPLILASRETVPLTEYDSRPHVDRLANQKHRTDFCKAS